MCLSKGYACLFGLFYAILKRDNSLDHFFTILNYKGIDKLAFIHNVKQASQTVPKFHKEWCWLIIENWDIQVALTHNEFDNSCLTSTMYLM